MSIEKIIGSIYQGEFDNQIDLLSRSIKDRRTELKRKKSNDNLFTIKRKDRVRITGIRPLYMVGKTGIVLDKRVSNMEISLDNPPTSGRFSYGTIIVPANCVEKI